MTTVNRSNMYEVQDYWISNIAPKYFDMDKINLNRAGLFGYVNEIEGHSIESIVNEAGILYNELFFKRAQIPETIYSYAAQYDVAETTAKPSTMGFSLIINEETLLNNSIKEGTSNYFIIDSDSEILVEEKIPFILDYDIKINIRKSKSGKYSYVARYMVDNLGNPISSITSSSNPYIDVVKIRYNRTNYVVLYVEGHQAVKTVQTQNIYSENSIDYFNFDIESGSDDQIADFSVYYRSPNSNTFEQIRKILIDKEAIDEKFCYYQFKDNNMQNTVNISFSSISRYFQPEFNSELKIEFYNTKGENGAFEYTGDNVSMRLNSDIYDYKDVVIRVIPTSNSVGGKDALDYDGIKNKVSIMSSTCNVLGTEIDLGKYFSTLEMTSKIKFVKKEDDVRRRLYGAFSLFKDTNDNIIPTNTLDIDLYKNDFDVIDESTKRYVLKAGTKFIYKPNSRIVSKLEDEEGLLFEPKFIFTNPFSIIVNRGKFFLNYYLTSIKSNFNTGYELINEKSDVNFIMSSLDIERNALESDKYKFSFNVKSTNEDSDLLFANLNDKKEFVSDNNKMKIYGVIYDEAGKISHYFDCKMKSATYNESVSEDTDNIFDDSIETEVERTSTTTYYYEAEIGTDDYISVYNGLRTTSNVRDAQDSSIKQPLINATDLKVKFCIFINEDDVDTSDDFHKYLPDIENKIISNVFTPVGKVALITDMNRLMYSTVLYEKNDENKVFFRLREIPLIKDEYMRINNYALSFYNHFYSDYLVLKEQLETRITNCFNISMKLYNTYGKSYYFYVNEKETNKLDQVNLKIAMKIRLNPNKLSDSFLKEEIIDYIQNYCESINDNEDLDLFISNLCTALEERFSDIIFIKFKYMNNYNSEVQSIEKNFPTESYDEKDKIRDFVPEYLNINKTFVDAYTTNKDVDIEFA